MADETETETAVETPDPSPAPPETVETPEKVHPLEPGGVRWNEVYAEKMALARENLALREQLARPVAPPAPQPPPQKFYTPQELQTMVDAGQTTPALVSAQLAWQAKELAKQEIRQETAVTDRRALAARDVNIYIEKRPSLLNSSSPEFLAVAQAAREVATDMGRDPNDPQVLRDPTIQRLALRATFGDHAKLTKVEAAREFSRSNADTFTETGGGGGRNATVTKDPYKDVPADLKALWERLKYTDAQKKAELPYVKKR